MSLYPAIDCQDTQLWDTKSWLDAAGSTVGAHELCLGLALVHNPSNYQRECDQTYALQLVPSV